MEEQLKKISFECRNFFKQMMTWKTYLRASVMILFNLWWLFEQNLHTRDQYVTWINAQYSHHQLFWNSVTGCVSPDLLTVGLTLIIFCDSFWAALMIWYVKIYEQANWKVHDDLHGLVLYNVMFLYLLIITPKWEQFLRQFEERNANFSKSREIDLAFGFIFAITLVHTGIREPFRYMNWHTSYPKIAHYFHYDMILNGTRCV